MIIEINAPKSCLSKLKAYTDSKGFGLSIEGKTDSFPSDSIYIAESYISNDNDQGLSNNSSQVQLPIYQCDIYTPKVMGKWKGIEIYDELVNEFLRASDISEDPSQQVFIEQVNKTRLPATDTHNRVVASINLRLIG